MRDYFNLIDTPVWNFYYYILQNDVGSGDITLTLGDDYSRVLYYLISIEAFQLSGGSNFDVSIEFVNESGKSYLRLADTENLNTQGEYLQFPNVPRGSGSATSHEGFHPTTSSMYLQPNGDTLKFTIEGLPYLNSVLIHCKAYNRGVLPNIATTGTINSFPVINKIR